MLVPDYDGLHIVALLDQIVTVSDHHSMIIFSYMDVETLSKSWESSSYE